MSALVLQWRVAPSAIDLQWRGPEGAVLAQLSEPARPIAGFVVPAATVTLTADQIGDGLEITGNQIRISIDELTLAP